MFKWTDNFSHIKNKLYKCCFFNSYSARSKYLSKSELIHNKAYDVLDKELDIIHILKTIHKLKAGLSVIIKNNPDLIKQSSDLYLNHTAIYSDSGDEAENHVCYEFSEFLKVDDR